MAQRYNQAGVKPDGAPTHKAPELRNYFGHFMFHIGKFHGIYENNCRNDGERYELRRRAGFVASAIHEYCQQRRIPTLGIKLKDQSKFRAGIEAALAQGSKRMRLVGSQSLSSSGLAPTDLTKSVEVLQPTPRRPTGVEAAKGKGKTQGRASQSTDGDAEGDVRIAGYAQLHKFYKLYRDESDDRVKTDIWKTISGIKKQYGLDSDDDA